MLIIWVIPNSWRHCVLCLFFCKLTYPLLLYKTCFKNFYYTTGNPGILINCSVTQYCNINTLLSGNEVGINAVIFILFTRHNFKLYLEWSRDATQGYFVECRMQNGIVLNMQMKQENNLVLFFNPLRKMPFCILQDTPARDTILCWFALCMEAFSFQYLPSPTPPPLPPHPHVCPHLLRSTQIHGNRNSKIDFKDISKVQMEKSWNETHFWHAKQIIAWENRHFVTPLGKPLVTSQNVICFVRLSK